MVVRQIVKIDDVKCDGCGQCIVNCPEGALEIVDGKARVVSESYCDGLGACIGVCPVDAITIETRETDAFDEEAVERNMAAARAQQTSLPVIGAGCPGSAVRSLGQPAAPGGTDAGGGASQLANWPVQLALVPPNAPFLREANLLLAADCVPIAMAGFHSRLLAGRPVVVGCPKLDDPAPYVAKLADIITQAAICSLTIARMEVPCCGGLCQIVRMAFQSCGRSVPVKEVVVGADGRIVSEQDWQEGGG